VQVDKSVVCYKTSRDVLFFSSSSKGQASYSSTILIYFVKRFTCILLNYKPEIKCKERIKKERVEYEWISYKWTKEEWAKKE